MRKAQRKTVYLEDVIKALPLNSWFTVSEFSTLTQIGPLTSYGRVAKMVKLKQLERSPQNDLPHTISLFRLTEENKATALEQAVKNKAERGRKAAVNQKNHGNYGGTRAGMSDADTKEFIEQENYLKQVGFI